MAIEYFDSFEDLIEVMRRDQKEADSRVQPWQAEIKPGDNVIRDSRLNVPIYSEILPDPKDRPAPLKHYRFTRSYSVVCPDGEYGDIQVSTIKRKLTQEEFEEAKQRGWYP